MNIESLLKRGNIHTEYCEDAVFYTTVGDDWLIGAVMDGCSSAKDSYFASALFTKLLSKACKTLPFIEEIQPGIAIARLTPSSLGEFILNQVFNDLKKTKKQLLIDEIEILSTLLLIVVNVKNTEAWVNVSGDGFIAIDKELIEIDQNNMPDYAAYHLNLPFNAWFKNHTKSYEYKGFKSISVATDGISKLLNKNGLQPKNINPAEMLMLSSEKNYLTNIEDTLTLLMKKYKLLPYDDIGIIRFS